MAKREESTDLGVIVIREAKRDDCQDIIKLSKEIADFHKHYNSPQIDAKVLERDLFDTNNPIMGFYVAVTSDDDDDNDNKIIGYGQYNYGYTLRLGRTMCLQDLYVKEKYRNRKVGDKLMQAIAKKAIEQNIGKMEFVVTDWNPAKSFYKRRGAVDVTETEAFHCYQFNRDALTRIASNS